MEEKDKRLLFNAALVAGFFVLVAITLYACIISVANNLDSHLYRLVPTLYSLAKEQEALGPENPKFVHLRALSMLIESRLNGTGYLEEGGRKNPHAIMGGIEFLRNMEVAESMVWKRLDELKSDSSLDESLRREHYSGEATQLNGIKTHMEALIMIYGSEPVSGDDIAELESGV